MAHKEGKKNRKYGRAGRSPAHNRYNGEMRWLRNRERRIKRHLKRHPNDKQASKALEIQC